MNRLELMNQERMISMPLDLYKADIEQAKKEGQRKGAELMLDVIKESKPSEKVIKIYEFYEGNDRLIRSLLHTLGLKDEAQKIFGPYE